MVFIITIMRVWTIETEGKLKTQTCKNSVITHAAMKMKIADFSKSIVCPAEDVEIEGNNEKDVMYGIANRMAYCWDMFGQGELNLFEDPHNKKNYCAMCYYLTFENKEIVISFSDFSKFLKTKKYKGGKTYAEFLKMDETTLDEAEANVENAIIHTVLPYSVLFINGKWNNNLFVIVAGKIIEDGDFAVAMSLGGIYQLGGSPATPFGAVLFIDGTRRNLGEYNQYPLLYPHTPETIKLLNCDTLPVRGDKGS